MDDQIQPGSAFALINWYHDGSGLISAWGPFASEAAARAAQAELESIQVFNQYTIIPLRRLVPIGIAP